MAGADQKLIAVGILQRQCALKAIGHLFPKARKGQCRASVSNQLAVAVDQCCLAVRGFPAPAGLCKKLCGRQQGNEDAHGLTVELIGCVRVEGAYLACDQHVATIGECQLVDEFSGAWARCGLCQCLIGEGFAYLLGVGGSEDLPSLWRQDEKSMETVWKRPEHSFMNSLCVALQGFRRGGCEQAGQRDVFGQIGHVTTAFLHALVEPVGHVIGLQFERARRFCQALTARALKAQRRQAGVPQRQHGSQRDDECGAE